MVYGALQGFSVCRVLGVVRSCYENCLVGFACRYFGQFLSCFPKPRRTPNLQLSHERNPLEFG